MINWKPTQRELLFFAVGVLAGIVIIKFAIPKGKKLLSASSLNPNEEIKLGAKGKGVLQLQEIIGYLSGAQLEPTGTYDRGTRDLAKEIFAGTTALVNPDQGEMSPIFIGDLYTAIKNSTAPPSQEEQEGGMG